MIILSDSRFSPDAEMISSRNVWAVDQQHDLDYMFSENRRSDNKSNWHGSEWSTPVSHADTDDLPKILGLTVDELFYPKVPRRLSGSGDSGFHLCYGEVNNDSGLQRGCSDAEFEDVGWMSDAKMEDLAKILGLTEENLFYLQMPKRLSASRDCGFHLCHSGFRRSCLDGDFEDPFDEIQDQLNGTKAWAEPCSDCNDIEQEIGEEFEDSEEFEDDASVEFEDAFDHFQDCYEDIDCESV